jgi:DNA-binding transcriptional regulator YdaS (Cro superfamily)
MTPIQLAIQAVGSQSDLARLLSTPDNPVLAQHINNWKKRGVPAERCIAIETATAGAVTRYDLRPDVFGQARDPQPDVKAA